jgi:TRAP-type C4-dicarboxylate transport system permease small subunit
LLIHLLITFLYIAGYRQTDSLYGTTAKEIAAGGIPKEFFLGAVLFMIFIMVMLLVIKIMNSSTGIKKTGGINNLQIIFSTGVFFFVYAA